VFDVVYESFDGVFVVKVMGCEEVEIECFVVVIYWLCDVNVFVGCIWGVFDFVIEVIFNFGIFIVLVVGIVCVL